MAFLVLGSGGGAVTVPVPRTGGMEEQPDGAGKRRWTVTSAPISEADYAALRALVGTPGFAEAERAWNGTLLTDVPLTPVSGTWATAAGIASAEVRITGAPYGAPLRGSEDCHARRVSLTLREP